MIQTRERTRAQGPDLSQNARDELAITSLADFVRQAWEVLEPRPLAWNWHIDLICAELENVHARHMRGERTELVICIPPGAMKSLLVSVFFLSWQWLQTPGKRVLAFANDDSLARRDSRRMRALISSEWYQRLVHRQARLHRTPEWSFADDQNLVTHFENSAGGFRHSLGIGSAVTGKRGDGFVIDDPVDAKEVVLGSVEQVAARMEAVREVFDSVLSSRLNDEQSAFIICIMQRLHEDDLAGVMMRREGTRSVVLPMEYDPQIAHPKDPRTMVGELLHAKRWPREVVERRKVLMGRHYHSQYAQRPTAQDGSVFLRGFFKERWRRIPEHLDEICITVDCTFKGTKEADYVAIQTWGRVGRKKYLIDRDTAQRTFLETLDAILRMLQRWPRAYVLIEEAANGSAVLDVLRANGIRVVAFDPSGASKQARAQLAAVSAQSGEVVLPDEGIVSWLSPYLETLLRFPAVSRDDDVDATSQLLIYWSNAARPTSASAALSFLLG